MTLSLLLCIITTLLPSTQSAVITNPTDSTNDTVIFSVSDYSGNYQSDTIDCGSITNCVIQCYVDYECEEMTIIADSATNLIIDCNGTDSCSFFKMYKGPSNMLDLSCNGYGSCIGFTIDIANSTLIQIRCENGDGQETGRGSSCEYSDVYIANIATFRLQCGPRSCIWIFLNATSVDTVYLGSISNIAGGYGYSMEHMEVHILDAINITINATTYRAFRSADLYLSSTDSVLAAGSLTMMCTENEACPQMGLHLTEYQSSAHVECIGNVACQYSNVYVPETRDSFLTCKNGTDDEPACNSMTLYMTDAFDESLLSVDCDEAADSCQSLYAYRCTDIENQDSCIGSRYFALSPITCSNAIDSHCEISCDVEDCTLRDIDGSLAQSLTVDCGSNGCAFMNIICPVSIGGKSDCIIHCNTSGDACKLTNILNADDSGGTMASFKLFCDADNACQRLSVDLDPVSIDSVEITADDDWQLKYGDIIIDSQLMGSAIINCTTNRFACYQSSWYIGDSSLAAEDLTGSVIMQGNGCDGCTIDMQNVAAFRFICEEGSTCPRNDIYCPPNTGSCILRGFQTDSFLNLEIFVDESYSFQFLDIEYPAASKWENVTVDCIGDANIGQTVMVYNDTDGEYDCNNGNGASYCCPDRNCSILNDPKMGFDSDLLDIDTFEEGTIWYNDTVELLEKSETCTGSTCALRCRNLLSCAFSTFIIESNETIIECNNLYSCLGATITADEHLVDHNVTILCLGSNSCGDIKVIAMNTGSFSLYCAATRSCLGVIVTLQIDDDSVNNTNHSQIHCIVSEACDDLSVVTNSRYTQLFMYQHSDGVVMDNGAGYLSDFNNIVCVTNEWIRFDGLLETEDTFTDSIEEYYPDLDSYPCSDVTVICDNKTTSLSESCTMTHQVSLDAISSLFSASDDNCTLINVQGLQSVSCNGICASSPTMTPTTSASPTASPTMSPSFSPTQHPSQSPTLSPSMAPSDSPTQFPVAIDEYNSWIEMQYAIDGLNDDEIEWIAESLNQFINGLSRIIERALDDDKYIQFRDIEVNVTAINDITINKLIKYARIRRESVMADGNVTVTSYTNCSSEVYCNYIVGADPGVTLIESLYDESRFENFATNELREYLDLMVLGVDAATQNTTSSIQFSITDHSSEAVSLEVIGVTTDATDYAVLVYLSISGMICMVGFGAKIYELGVIPKLIPKVDSSLWTAWLAFGLQFGDFAGDISTSFKLWSHSDLWNERRILVAAIGNVAFMVIPYLCNLRIAVMIKKYISKNGSATTWFQSNSSLFISLVVFTGGAFPALELVSSRVFGLDILSSGLTRFELRQQFGIKIFNSVVLEDIPQLICQTLYYSVTTSSGVSQTVIFSSIASILNVLASVLTYFLDRRNDDDEMVPMEYYLTTKCQNAQRALVGASPAGATTTVPLERKGDDLTKNEIARIESRRGLTKKMGRSLAQLWGIPEGTIEVGHTVVTKKGAITHIVHFMKRDDISAYSEALYGNVDDHLSPWLIIRQFYESKKRDLCGIIRTHFGLSDEFIVSVCNRSSVRQDSIKKSARRPSAFSGGDPQGTASPNSTTSLMQRDDPSGGGGISPMLRNFFDFGRKENLSTNTFEEKRANLLEIVDRMNPSTVNEAAGNIDDDSNALTVSPHIDLDESDSRGDDAVEMTYIEEEE